MSLTRILLAASVALFSFAVAPAAASEPCIVGNEYGGERWFATTHTPICITDPCDGWRVCVGWGLVCIG